MNANISVVIPSRNGAATIGLCLTALKAQSLQPIEIIVLDTDSTDGTVAIAEGFDVKIVHIRKHEFGHGRTRNLGAEIAKGELIYYTVQDAALAEKGALENLALHFHDPRVMGVNGIQGIPHDKDKNPALWFKRSSQPAIEMQHFDKNVFNHFSPQEQFTHSSWDDVNAMYRRTALLKLKFRDVNYAEDRLWAKDALANGHCLVKDPSVVAWHYHHMSYQYTLKEKFTISYQFYRSFSVKPSFPSPINGILKRWYSIIRNDQVSYGKKLYWCWHNLLSYSGHLNAVLIFRAGLLMGSKALEKIYATICEVVPQGQIKK